MVPVAGTSRVPSHCPASGAQMVTLSLSLPPCGGFCLGWTLVSGGRPLEDSGCQALVSTDCHRERTLPGPRCILIASACDSAGCGSHISVTPAKTTDGHPQIVKNYSHCPFCLLLSAPSYLHSQFQPLPALASETWSWACDGLCPRNQGHPGFLPSVPCRGVFLPPC